MWWRWPFQYHDIIYLNATIKHDSQLPSLLDQCDAKPEICSNHFMSTGAFDLLEIFIKLNRYDANCLVIFGSYFYMRQIDQNSQFFVLFHNDLFSVWLRFNFNYKNIPRVCYSFFFRSTNWCDILLMDYYYI